MGVFCANICMAQLLLRPQAFLSCFNLLPLPKPAFPFTESYNTPGRAAKTMFPPCILAARSLTLSVVSTLITW